MCVYALCVNTGTCVRVDITHLSEPRRTGQWTRQVSVFSVRVRDASPAPTHTRHTRASRDTSPSHIASPDCSCSRLRPSAWAPSSFQSGDTFLCPRQAAFPGYLQGRGPGTNLLFQQRTPLVTGASGHRSVVSPLCRGVSTSGRKTGDQQGKERSFDQTPWLRPLQGDGAEPRPPREDAPREGGR